MTRANGAQIARFGGVGLAATATHAAVLAGALSLGLHEGLGNAAAFGVAVWVSYWGQRLWVFGRPPRHMAKFLAVAVMGLAVHGVGLPVLVGLGMDVWPAWLVLTVMVPVLTFLAARFWAFAPDRPTP